MNKKDLNKEQCEIQDTLSFILGGNSDFSIENLASHNRYKYRVKVSKDNPYMYFAYANGGRDEDRASLYIGYVVRKKDGSWFFQTGEAGKLPKDSPQVKGLLYALKFGDRPLNRPMILYHHGKCAKCGRKLTDAESISRGFGPDCWKKIKGLM